MPADSLLRDAEVALRLDDTERAADLYQRVLGEEGPEGDKAVRSQALEGLGQLAMRQSDSQRAIELFREALAVTGEDQVDRLSLAEGLARTHAVLGELAAAISILERWLERYQDDPIQYVRFASFAALGEHEQAAALVMELTQELGDAQPVDRGNAYVLLAETMVQAGSPE